MYLKKKGLTFHNLYTSIVVQHKVLSHQYFLEELNFPELMIIIKAIPYAEVEAWNRTRNMMLSMLSPYMKRRMSASELFPLIIDEDYKEKEELTKEISNEEVNWYKNFVKNYKKEEK